MSNKEKDEKKEKTGLREKIADTANMSKEIILNTALISCIGNREMTLENYKSIVEYTNECIRIKTKPHIVKICGEKLEIRTINRDILYITGKISSIAYT